MDKEIKDKITLALAILLAFLIVGFLLMYLAWSFGPGGYPRAEVYEFAIPEDSLIQIIYEAKEENQNIKIPNELIEPIFNEGRKDSTDHYYHVFFYYPDKNQVVKTATRKDGKRKSTLMFIYIYDLETRSWIQVNEYFWWWKNKPLLDEFEKRILSKIQEKVK